MREIFWALFGSWKIPGTKNDEINSKNLLLFSSVFFEIFLKSIDLTSFKRQNRIKNSLCLSGHLYEFLLRRCLSHFAGKTLSELLISKWGCVCADTVIYLLKEDQAESNFLKNESRLFLIFRSLGQINGRWKRFWILTVNHVRSIGSLLARFRRKSDAYETQK